MRKTLTVLTILLAMVLTVRAQVFYEISGNGLKKKSYLLGTYHLLSTDDLINVKSVFKCFRNSETVVGEIVLNEQEAAQKMAEVMMAKEPFTKYLTEEDSLMVDSVLKADIGAGVAQLSVIKPAYVFLMWEQLALMQGKQKDKEFMDSFFQTAAAMSGMQIKGLETIEQQLAFIAADDEKDTRDMVEYFREGKAKIIEETKALQEAYLAQDLEKILQLATVDRDQEDLERIAYSRNRNWAEQLPEMMKESSCFVVVGAMHLVGDQGVVNLLKKKGYKVKPIK